MNPEGEGWAKLLLREHMDPSAAFQLVYNDAAKGAVDVMAALIARASGRNASETAVLIESFSHLGEVLVFRLTRHALVRRLGWGTLGAAEAKQIRQALGWN